MIPLLTRLFDAIWTTANLGARPEDDQPQQVRKAVMTMTAMIIGFLAVFWGGAYVLIGYPLSGAIPLTYSLITLFSLLLYFRYKRFELFRFSQLALILLLPYLLQWSLGGFSNGSIVMIWAFFTPLAVLLVDGPSSGIRWLSAFMVLAIFSALIDPLVAASVPPMPEAIRTTFFLLNLAVGLLSVYAVLDYFVKNSRRYQHQLQTNERRITELMLTDPLTGVANRRHLESWLAQQVRIGAWPLSLIMADMDHFKNVNDSFGHEAGDRVLCEFVQRVSASVRSQDLVARFGGEEFVVVLPATPCEEARVIAERIRCSVQEELFAPIGTRVTASFGVACSRSDDVGRLLARADRELYRAKAMGRNCVSVEAV